MVLRDVTYLIYLIICCFSPVEWPQGREERESCLELRSLTLREGWKDVVIRVANLRMVLHIVLPEPLQNRIQSYPGNEDATPKVLYCNKKLWLTRPTSAETINRLDGKHFCNIGGKKEWNLSQTYMSNTLLQSPQITSLRCNYGQSPQVPTESIITSTSKSLRARSQRESWTLTCIPSPRRRRRPFSSNWIEAEGRKLVGKGTHAWFLCLPTGATWRSSLVVYTPFLFSCWESSCTLRILFPEQPS